MMKCLDRIAKDLVACVRAADSHKILIFARNVGNDVPFAFAAVLSAHKDIDDSCNSPRVASQLCHRTDQNVVGRTLVSFYNDIRNVRQVFDIAFGPIDPSPII
jgi:hypothetical protein